MLASAFIKALQEAGISWEKVPKEKLANQPNGRILVSPGIRFNVGSEIYLYALENIRDMTTDEWQIKLDGFKQDLNMEVDFATLPEKGEPLSTPHQQTT